MRGGKLVDHWERTYQKWLHYTPLDRKLRHELEQIKDDEEALQDAFYTNLSFGTGGIRGILGPGTNRINLYTVRKMAYGIAKYVQKDTVNYKNRGIVIAYDSRHQSQQFAYEIAKVLGTFHIKTYIFKSIQPTPLLSFAIRYLGTVAGLMITASHNPPNYNGVKVYNEYGSQLTDEAADHVLRYINEVEDELQVETVTIERMKQHSLLTIVQDEVMNAYLKQLKYLSKYPSNQQTKPKDLRIVFTPLHGTATTLVTEGLKQLGFNDIHLVKDQVVPDPDFSTVPSPNPEDEAAFAQAKELGLNVEADLLLATDPDADRLGIAVKNERNTYTFLNGNELGVLLLDYILSHTDVRLRTNARFIKTIVTSELGRAIADHYGVKTIDTLTGFKYIGEKINEFDATGESFIFGYEESYGYLMSNFVRDKDAVQSAIMTCEMAMMWREKGLSLLDALDKIYERHGFYKEGVDDLVLTGIEGKKEIAHIMDRFRNQSFSTFAGEKVLYVEDYLQGIRKRMNSSPILEEITLPKENVIKYVLDHRCWICIRPSGTEPKIKWYYGAYGETEEEMEQRLKKLQQSLHDFIVLQEQL